MTRFLTLVMAALLISCQPHKKDHPIAAEALTRTLDSISKQGIFNGFSVAVVNPDGTLYERGFGLADVQGKKPYTETTIQNIASISKTFIGLALMKAQDLGKLNLDDPVNKYLPFDIVHPEFPDATITIRHLATHTSGIVDNNFYLTKNYCLKKGETIPANTNGFDDSQVWNPADSLVTMETYLKNVLVKGNKWYAPDTFLKNKPGAIYEYSNTGATLAALIVEKATGQPFDAFTEEHILKPLGMTASGWHFADIDFNTHARLYADPKTALPFYTMSTYPDGNFISSAHDMALYLSELIKGYHGQGKILSQKAYKEFFAPQLNAGNFQARDTQNPYNESYNVGIFMGFGYSGYVGHTGGDPGVATMMFFDPKTNIGRILITNTSFSGQKGGKAFYAIWDALEKHQAHLTQ